MQSVLNRVLFITRQFFDPPHSGAFIYSSQFVRAFCEIAKEVVVFAHPNESWRFESDMESLRGYPGNMDVVLRGHSSSGAIAQQLSFLPAVAARFNTARSRKALAEVLTGREFDVVVIDSISSAWAVPLIKKAGIPVIVHVALNDEYLTKMKVSQSSESGFVERWAHRIDALKVRIAEDQLLRISRAVCCISEEDRETLSGRVPGARAVVCPAGYEGPVVEGRSIQGGTPRRICLLGSFLWGAKRLNLKAFLSCGYQLFREADIEVVIVGNMEDGFREEVSEMWPGVEFTGRVDDVSHYLNPSRIGVIPEEVGGGFKLKIFDYIFRRVPVFALREAMSQVPLEHGRSVMLFDSMEELCRGIVENIDAVENLNKLQTEAFNECESYLGLTGIRGGLQKIFGQDISN